MNEDLELSVENMFKKKDIKGLIKALKHKDINIRYKARDALAKIGRPAIKSLIKALRNGNKDVRYWVASALAIMEDEMATKLIIQALKDKDYLVRNSVTRALRLIRDKDVLNLLLNRAQKDEDYYIRSVVTETLTMMGDNRGIELLVQALKTEDSPSRWMAALTLGKIGDEKSIESLIQALKDEDSEVRTEVASSLGDIGDKRAVESLIQALKDEDNDVRVAAAYALGDIGDKRAVESLIQALKDEDWIVRSTAAYTLREFEDKRATKPLIQVIKDDENRDVKNTAEEALLWILENGKYKRVFNYDKLRENDRVEFKSSLRWDVNENCVNKELQKSVTKTIAAFLNTKGGTLFIGIKDDCSINGIENDINSLKKKDIDGFWQVLTQIIVNYLGAEIIPNYIKIDFYEEEKTICKVKVKKSSRPVFLKSEKGKEFYIRTGNTTRSLDIEETCNYIKEHWKWYHK